MFKTIAWGSAAYDQQCPMNKISSIKSYAGKQENLLTSKQRKK